ncbi:hypothetical protein DL93DRAFT_2084229 [Clavulina sp. PMI_390]|nr:hypothetical protein DL93DRAFT_2084229 [Clavulina sp. PMI_390]
MHALDIDEVDLSLPPPLLASRSLSTNPITGQQYFSAWYEDASGVWCSEAELCSPSSSEPAPDSDICKPALHPQLPEARQAIRNIEKVTGSIPSSVFGDPDLWDPIARQWYERGTKRTLRGRLIDMLPQHKRGATQIHTTIINSLSVSPKGYSFAPQPQLLPDRSYPGDGRHCLSLACPFTATKHGLVEFPLEDRANIVLTQVVGGRQGNGGKRLKHELLMVRGSPQASNSQGVAGVSGFHDGVKPLVVRSGEVLVLWSTISGVVVIREPSLKGYHTMVYRFIQGAG